MKKFIILFFAVVLFASCGVTTSVKVRQAADNTNTTISIRNGEGASTAVNVDVAPTVSVKDSVVTIIHE